MPLGRYIVSAGQEEQSMSGEASNRYGHRLTYHPAAFNRSKATIIEVTEGSESTGVDITFGRPVFRYFASGRIVDGETGKPLANLRYGVSKFSNPGFGGFYSSGRDATNEQGEFKLQNLAPGSYALVAEGDAGPDLRVEPHRFEVVDRDVTGLIVKTTKGGSISGTVILEGTDSKSSAGIGRARITTFVATRNGVRELNRSAVINADGTFRIGGLPGGEAKFMVSGRYNTQITRIERDGVAYSSGIEIKELEHVTGVRIFVGHGTATVRGTVTLANGSSPPENRVNVMVKHVTDDPARAIIRGAHVDARGQFVLEGLLPGTYEVTAAFGSNTFEVLKSKTKGATRQVVLTSDNVSNVTLTLPEP